MVKEHIHSCLDRIEEIFEKLSSHIEALKPGEKILSTDLANLVGKDYGMTGPQLYPVMLFLIRGYPGVLIKRGAQGGIYKLEPTAKSEEIVEEFVAEVSEPAPEEDKTLPIINT